MPICPECSKKFHACGSCGLSYDWEYEYCSDVCWNKSEKYKKGIEMAKNIKQKLTPEEKEWLDTEDASYYFDKVE